MHLHIVLPYCVTDNGNIIIPSSLGFTTSSLLGDIPSSFHLTGRAYYKCRRLPESTGEVFSASYSVVVVNVQNIVIHWKILTFKLMMY